MAEEQAQIPFIDPEPEDEPENEIDREQGELVDLLMARHRRQFAAAALQVDEPERPPVAAVAPLAELAAMRIFDGSGDGRRREDPPVQIGSVLLIVSGF